LGKRVIGTYLKNNFEWAKLVSEKACTNWNGKSHYKVAEIGVTSGRYSSCLVKTTMHVIAKINRKLRLHMYFAL